MKIGLVGYKGSGKSTLFTWLTGIPADPALAHTGQSAMAPLRDPRVDKLAAVYHPKKITHTSLEIVDTPGLSRTHEGNAARLAMLREAGCLVLVVAGFGGADPPADLRAFHEDLILADMEIVAGRIGRVEDTLRKPRSKQDREQTQTELEILRRVMAGLESGTPVGEAELPEEHRKVTRAFRLFSEKPRMVVVNIKEDEPGPERFTQAAPPGVPLVTVPASLELELSQMTAAERAEFERELGVGHADRDQLLRAMMDVSGQMVFLTAGEKEVRSWMIPKGATALEAAGAIHTDLARGFIRAEVMTAGDLLRLGSEREVKAHHLVRQEPKDYVVQDDDVLLIRFSV
jgi:hypothetical protein